MININNIIHANGVDIRINTINEIDYISLTDIAKKQNAEYPADS